MADLYEFLKETLVFTQFYGHAAFLVGMWLLFARQPEDAKQAVKAAAKLAGAFIGWLFICFCMENLVWGEPVAAMISDFLTLFLYTGFFGRHPARARVVYCAIYAAGYFLLTGINASAGLMLDNIGSAYLSDFPLSIPFLIVDVFLLVFLLRMRPVEKFEPLPLSYVLLMVGISAVGIMQQIYNMTAFAKEDYTDKVRHYTLFLNAGDLLLVLVGYLLFYTTCREYSRRTELMAESHREEVDETVLLAAQKTYESLREIRHEIKNHDAYMEALLDAGEYDKLKEYFSASHQANMEAVRMVQTGNHQVDAIVNSRMTRAKLLGVTMETMLAVPRELPYEERDFCSLLSNLMDNALEACAGSGAQGKERRVLLSIRPQNNYLFIHTENPVDLKIPEERRLSLRTTKDNEDLHGYGTAIIRRIAEKYNGAFRCRMKDGMFLADVMLSYAENPYTEESPAEKKYGQSAGKEERHE